MVLRKLGVCLAPMICSSAIATSSSPSIASAGFSEEVLNQMDFSALIQGPMFPLNGPKGLQNPVQSTLVKFTQLIKESCQSRFGIDLNQSQPWGVLLSHPSMRSEERLACAWPLVLEDFNHSGTVLQKDQNRGKSLALTMAAGLYEFDLFAPPEDPGIPFIEAQVVRWLFGMRHLRMLWPKARNFFVASVEPQGSETDQMMIYLLEPWLTSLSPWSMTYKFYESVNCSKSSRPSCWKTRKALLASLQKASSLMDEELEWRVIKKSLARGPIDIILSPQSMRVYASLQTLFANVTGLGDQHYILPYANYGHNQNISALIGLKSYYEVTIKDYAKNSGRPLEFESSPCKNIEAGLRSIQPSDLFPWVEDILAAEPKCEIHPNGIRVTSYQPDFLLNGTLLNRYTVLQLRKNLSNLMSPQQLDSTTLNGFLIVGLFDDISATLKQVKAVRLSEESTPDSAQPVASLVHFLSQSAKEVAMAARPYKQGVIKQ